MNNVSELTYKDVVGFNENIKTNSHTKLRIVNTDMPFENFCFDTGNFLDLEAIKKLPKNIIINNKYNVGFSDISFNDVESLLLDNCNNVYFSVCEGLPKCIKFNNIKRFYFENCDLSNVDVLKLEGECVAIKNSCILPKEIDFSEMRYVNMEDCCFRNTKKLILKNRYQLPRDCALQDLLASGVDVHFIEASNPQKDALSDRIRAMLQDKFK